MATAALHLVRHGRTAANRNGWVMGWADDPVEDDQLAAAEAIAARVVDLSRRPDAVWSSPVHRARQTAEPTARDLGVELVLDDRLGELHQGPWEGLLESEVADGWPEEWHRWRDTPETVTVEGRESLDELYGRVADVCAELTSVERTVVAFTHDAVIRAAVAWALGVGPSTYRRIEVANCSITTIATEAGTPRVVRVNDTSHLDPGRG